MVRTILQDVQDERTRDLIRGLLDRTSKRQEFDATMSRLLSTVQKADMQAFDDLLRKHPLFKHVEIAPEFPLDAPFNGNRGISLIPTGNLALDYVALRITENEDQICTAFDRLHSLNLAIHSDIDEIVAIAVGQVMEFAGHSLTLARKAAFIIGYSQKDSISHKVCADLVSAYGVNGKNYGMMVTIDAIGNEFNYLDLKYRFRDFATLERDAGIPRKISRLCFAPLAATKEDLIALVSASYEISLMDAAVALLSHRDHRFTDVIIPKRVLTAWEKLSAEPASAFPPFARNDSYGDLWAFRSAPAFLEYNSFRRLRYALQNLYTPPESESRKVTSLQYAEEFFAEVNRVSDVVPPPEHQVLATPKRFDRLTAGSLSRSCGLVWACEKDADFSNISTEEMARLMGQTFDIDRLVNTRQLRQAVSSTSNPFVKLILQTLLRAHSSATKDSFNFKDQFQRYVRDHHKGEILEFMEMVRSLDKKIVSYFVNLLDETMLSQMAFLMESSEAIYDTRARLLEWYAETCHDTLAKDRAKQLRLDRKIAAVRGAINETRLNIDSVRFRQWIEQNKLSDFSDFSRQTQIQLPSISDLTDSSKRSTLFLAAHREPTKLALAALVNCYEEFCRNPDYGIASFLGRRIRHGTLRGTLLSGLPDANDSDFPPSLFWQYQAWMREFSASIDVLAGRLYFRDKSVHKDGLLSAEIDSEQKWQLCLIALSRIHAQAQQDGVTFVPLQIEQFCWLVFELELGKVQAFIGEARTKWGTLKLRHTPTDQAAANVERRTNITLSDHFATVMSWFRKPPNISPVAELAHVIQVIIGEAHEEYVTFNPAVTCGDNLALELSGATYYVVYDALTIAFRNAAKHGLHPGRVKIEANVNDRDAGKTLEVAITSDLKPNADISDVLVQIENAGRAGANDADIVEGLSGFRKLKKLERERSILSFAASAGAESVKTLRISIVFPFKGLVE